MLLVLTIESEKQKWKQNQTVLLMDSSWISNISGRLLRSGIVSTWDLRWDIFKLYLVRNCFLSLYLFPLSLWYGVYCSLQIWNTVWMGDSICQSSEFIGFRGKCTALEKNPDTRLITVLRRWYLYITGCREEINCTNQPASLRDYS